MKNKLSFTLWAVMVLTAFSNCSDNSEGIGSQGLSAARKQEISNFNEQLKNSMLATNFFKGEEVVISPLEHSTIKNLISKVRTSENQDVIDKLLANDILMNMQSDGSLSFVRWKETSSFLTPVAQNLFDEMSSSINEHVEAFLALVIQLASTTRHSKTTLFKSLKILKIEC